MRARFLFRPGPHRVGILALPTENLPEPNPDTACWLWLRSKLGRQTHPALRDYLTDRAAFHLSRLGPLLRSLRALSAAGHELLLLKGAALLAARHLPIGSREMADVDVLVRDVPGALKVLEERGWKVRYPERREHSLDLLHETEGKLDLHSRSVHEPGSDEGMWLRSRPAVFLGVPCRVPCETDLLFNLCIHGYRRSGSRARWACDAATLLCSRHREIDWKLLAGEAEARRVAFALRATVEFLAGMGVPAGELRPMATAWWEPLEFCVRSGLGPEHGLRRQLMPGFEYLRGDRSLVSIIARRMARFRASSPVAERAGSRHSA